jgi:hypothetical protein
MMFIISTSLLTIVEQLGSIKPVDCTIHLYPLTTSFNMEASDSNSKSRFVATQATAEDLLKEQSIGLVQLSDFRKRRAEALEQSGRESRPNSGATTPRDEYGSQDLCSLLETDLSSTER